MGAASPGVIHGIGQVNKTDSTIVVFCCGLDDIIYFITIIITLRASEAAAQCIVIAPVFVFVCLFVGPPYYRQRAVFASPLGAFFSIVIYLLNIKQYKASETNTATA